MLAAVCFAPEIDCDQPFQAIELVLAESKIRLLIVEDDLSLQQMLTWDFQDMGYQVTASSDCSGATLMLKRKKFDLALLDFNLPDGCGNDLLETVKTEQPESPIIIYSGRLPPGTITSGAYHFTPKPVTAKSLHQLFQRALTETDQAC